MSTAKFNSLCPHGILFKNCEPCNDADVEAILGDAEENQGHVGQVAARALALVAEVRQLRADNEQLRQTNRSHEEQLCRIADYLGRDARHSPDRTIAGLAIGEIQRLRTEFAAELQTEKRRVGEVIAELERFKQMLNSAAAPCPRYIVFAGFRQWKLCDTLAQALDWKGQIGGTIYEPLGMAAAEKVSGDVSGGPPGDIARAAQDLQEQARRLFDLKEAAITAIDFDLACVYRDARERVLEALAVLKRGAAESLMIHTDDVRPVCPECRGKRVINLGDDCDYHCPACVGSRPIVGHADGSVEIGPFTPVSSEPSLEELHEDSRRREREGEVWEEYKGDGK